MALIGTYKVNRTFDKTKGRHLGKIFLFSSISLSCGLFSISCDQNNSLLRMSLVLPTIGSPSAKYWSQICNKCCLSEVLSTFPCSSKRPPSLLSLSNRSIRNNCKQSKGSTLTYFSHSVTSSHVSTTLFDADACVTHQGVRFCIQ